MPFSIADMMYGVLVPAVIAAAVATASSRGFVRPSLRAGGAAVALVAGFFVGYALLALGPLRPTTHWHWLPWTVAISLGAAAVRPGRAGTIWDWTPWSLLAIFAAVAVITGWLLVPDWPDLAPSRGVHWVAWTAYIVAAAGLLTTIVGRPGSEARLPAHWVALVFAGTLLATAAVLVLSASLRFAQIAACGAGAALGLAVAAAIDPQRVDLRRLPLPLIVMAAGASLAGRVNSWSDVPLVSYLLVPLAPLALGLAGWGPLQRRSRGTRTALAVGAAVAVGLVAVAIAAVAELPGSGDAGG